MLDEFGCEWVGARQSYVGSCGGLKRVQIGVSACV
jgi:hypothetical protein